MTLGKRIRNYRIKRGFSQEQLGKMIGVEPGVISNYENDKYKPSADSVVRLAKVFFTTTDNLLLDNSTNQLNEIIPNQEWLNIFSDIMFLPEEEKNALKVVLKVLSKKYKTPSKTL